MSARCPPLAVCCDSVVRLIFVAVLCAAVSKGHNCTPTTRASALPAIRTEADTDRRRRVALYRSLQPRRSRYETTSGPNGQRRSCRRTLSLGRIASCAHPTQPTPPLRAAAADPHGVIGVCPSPTRARHELRPCSRTVALTAVATATHLEPTRSEQSVQLVPT
jgi:hypothetical protein